jgi:L-lactate dehydrogenase (cytochrome)
VAVALGADMAFIGRPYVYAVAAAGQAGVEHLLHLMTEQLRSTMQLAGVSSLAELRQRGPALLNEPVPG